MSDNMEQDKLDSIADESPMLDPHWERNQNVYQHWNHLVQSLDLAIKLENANVGVQDHAIQIERVVKNAGVFYDYLNKPFPDDVYKKNNA